MHVHKCPAVALIWQLGRSAGGRQRRGEWAHPVLGSVGLRFACCCVTEDIPAPLWSLFLSYTQRGGDESSPAYRPPGHSRFQCGHGEQATPQRGLSIKSKRRPSLEQGQQLSPPTGLWMLGSCFLSLWCENKILLQRCRNPWCGGGDRGS